MKVMIISRGYPSEDYPANGNHEYDYAIALRKNGIDAYVVALDLRSIRRKRSFGYGKRTVLGVPTYTVDLPGGAISKQILGRMGSRGLKRIYKDILKDGNKPDVIHAHFTEPAYAAALFNQEVGLPFVITEHSSEIRKADISKSLYQAAKYAYGACHVLIADSEALAQAIWNKFSMKAYVEPPAMDLSAFKVGPPLEGRLNFVTAGNLKPIKRMDLLIRAFAASRAPDHGAMLHIYGEGEERSVLAAEIASRWLEGIVILHGNATREELVRAYAQSDCFCLASQVENFGKVYVEALAAGLPVIGTRSGGPDGFVNETNGILVPVNDEEAFAQAFSRMAETFEDYDKEKIAKDARRHFGEEAVAQGLLKHFKTAMERRGL